MSYLLYKCSAMVNGKMLARAIIMRYSLFVCVLLIHFSALNASGHDKSLKIYMYPLGPHLNLDIAEKYSKWNPNIMDERGLGIPFNTSEFVFDTNQFALEQYFYHRIKNSEYLTDKREDADLYYVPFFPNLAKVAGEYSLYGKYWNEFNKFNKTYINETMHKHFMVYGGCQKYAQAFGSVGKALNVIMLEQNADKYAPSKLIIAPYPGQIHFYPDREFQVDYSKKDLLVSSAWNSRYPIRWELADMCRSHRNECVHIELSSNSDVYNHSYVFEVMLRSTFCLSPHGDSPTRKGFYDALLVGCINVIYDNTVKYPFDDQFQYENMTVYIPLSNKGKTFEILKQIPKERIIQMQQYIQTIRRHFQYTVLTGADQTTELPFKEKDAFNLLIDQVYKQSLQRENEKS